MHPPVDRTYRPQAVYVALCGLVLCCAGCRGSGWGLPLPFQRQQPVCVFPEGVGKFELVDYLNRNQGAVHAWRCTEATVKLAGPAGVPVRLTANMAVERPRNIRLRAKSIRGDEADLGSNSERFWFWLRDSQDRILTASHADADLVRGHLQIPFEPEWLMEALGVGHIDPSRYTMQHHGPGTNRATLISTEASASGQILHREIVVDTCRGQIVEHGLYDMNHQPIARAILGDYRTIGTVSLPHRVELIWSRSGERMVMQMRNIEINPQISLEKMWVFPEIDGAQTVDLGEQIRLRQQTMGTTQLPHGRRGPWPSHTDLPASASGAAQRWQQPVMRQVSQSASTVPTEIQNAAHEQPWGGEAQAPTWETGAGSSAQPLGRRQTGVARVRSTESSAADPAEPPWSGTAW